MMATEEKGKNYQCNRPPVKCMLVIKPSFSRLLFLPEERILYSVQVKSQNHKIIEVGKDL